MKGNIIVVICIAYVLIIFALNIHNGVKGDKQKQKAINQYIVKETVDTVWQGPDEEQIPFIPIAANLYGTGMN